MTKDLVADLQKQLRTLEADLLAIAESDAKADADLHARYRQAANRSRTGLSFETWRAQQLTQIAAGWLLACVYTRFCEDNGLLDHPMLAGSDDRLAEARERQTEYFRIHPKHSDLHYLRAAIDRLQGFSATRALVDKHNPMRLLDPAPDRASDLLDFWRRIDPETGKLVHDFTDPKLGTRFLGDLYQDLSEQARKDYALLQTPDFIEEFILDRTLDPAINEYGLAEVKLIDPACGSGHFLLGAFTRLLKAWRDQEPGTNVRVLAERALKQVHGVDLNPYAAAIARFRLVIAALSACKITSLADAPTWKIRVAIGDSLKFGVHASQGELEGVVATALTGMSGEGEFVYEYEDAVELQEILVGQRYHAVVANPPYITVKDPILNTLYRDLWWACSGKYALSVPFAQRLYDLAIPGGYTGQITSNSFMKREFGKKLIEQFFKGVDLNLVIDTSGAYIPGHGTPTVIICGRNRKPVKTTVRAVLGIRGEPGTPSEPAKGLVWTSITDHFDNPGIQTEYISVTDLDRGVIDHYPWSLSGGGASDVLGTINGAGTIQLKIDLAGSIGFASFPGADDVFLLPRHWATRHSLRSPIVRDLIVGEVIRDWCEQPEDIAIVPYDREHKPVKFDAASTWGRHVWNYRAVTENVVGFGGQTRKADGACWWTWYRWVPAKYKTSLSITLAFVSTHNHFVLDRGGNAFKQTAPIIKLKEGSTERDHLRLIGLLNSSALCFWMKQVCFDRGNGGIGGGIASEDWERFYEFAGTKLEQIPLPNEAPVELAARLDGLANDLQRVRPTAVAADGVPTRAGLDLA
ncbi:MAG TPA: BREX-2 system adenine-specific DNA-methyltransferase PglX, partial [Streptosporangiaceae bacterium]